MLDPSCLPHEKCRQSSDSLHVSLYLYYFASRQRVFPCPYRCSTTLDSIWTGKKAQVILRSAETFRRHLLQPHIPERCAKRVKILTDRITRMHTYPVAHGGFSDVWSCQWQYKKKPPKRVAVKAIRPVIANSNEKRRAIHQELEVWASLTHRNILPLYGITYGFGPLPAFVCPWAEHGTLSEYLEKFETQLDLQKRLTLLGDISTGLQYLHSRNIVHGDLSSFNVLIMKSGRACLSDFGLSELIKASDTAASDISFLGNIRWAAPELLDKCNEDTPVVQFSSRESDIYAFGSIMLQILTGKIPFHWVQRAAQIVIMVSRGHRPQREPRWDGLAIPDELWEFVQTCWLSPSKRPSSERIVHFIRSQLTSLDGDVRRTRSFKYLTVRDAQLPRPRSAIL